MDGPKRWPLRLDSRADPHQRFLDHEGLQVTNEPVPGVKGGENGVVVFKLLRGAADASNRAKVTIVGRNPEAIWFSGYDDRVIVDEAELYSMYDIPAISAVAAE